MTLAMQFNLWGEPITTGDVVAKVTHLLETDEGTRDHYAELVGRFWLEFDGLDAVLPVAYQEPFLRWLNNGATSWKTIQNRCMEIQRQRPDLDASPEVQAQRQRQSKQGAVR